MFGFGKKARELQEQILNNLKIVARESVETNNELNTLIKILASQNILLKDQLDIAKKDHDIMKLSFKEETGVSAPETEGEQLEYENFMDDQELDKKAFDEMYLDDISVSRNEG